MREGAHRVAYVSVREALIVTIAAFGAVLFLNHPLLYLEDGFVPYSGPLAAYVLVTVVLWLFLRGALFAAAMRPVRVRDGVEICPECGQRLDDGTPSGLETHRRVPLTPRPTEREVIAAVALRRAVDDARAIPRHAHPVAGNPLARITEDVENRPRSLDPTSQPPNNPPAERAPKGPRTPQDRP